MNKISLPAGTYIAAVSGGVDSMVLLDLLAKLPEVKVVVGHVNHGIRADSGEDAQLVERVCMSHNITYEMITLQLGANVSEEKARNERYKFLRHLAVKHRARAIITAHHADDVLETAIINLLRGTGWRGLCSLRSTADIVRPLLGTPKAELVEYARDHHVIWREDTTNESRQYLRNYVRHELLAKASTEFKETMWRLIVRQNELADQIDQRTGQWLLANAVGAQQTTLPRYDLIMMPKDVAHELLQTLLRQKSGKSMIRPLAQRALLFCKVAKAGKVFHIDQHWQLRAEYRDVIVEPRSAMIS